MRCFLGGRNTETIRRRRRRRRRRRHQFAQRPSRRGGGRMMEEEGKEGEISPPPPPPPPPLLLPWLVLPSHSRYRPSMSSTTTAKCSTNARTGRGLFSFRRDFHQRPSHSEKKLRLGWFTDRTGADPVMALYGGSEGFCLHWDRRTLLPFLIPFSNKTGGRRRRRGRNVNEGSGR